MQRKSCKILDSPLFLRHKIYVAMEKITSADVQCFLEQFHEKMKVFGKDVKGREVYIKIMISQFGGQTICISFHLAEHKLNYPFK